MLMDTFVLQWTTTPLYVLIVNLLEGKGLEGWSTKVYAMMFASFKFLPFYKTAVYSVALIFRPLVAYIMAVFWGVILSYI